MLNHLKKVWKGEEKLWKVFWLWGVFGLGLLIFLQYLLNAYSYFYLRNIILVIRIIYIPVLLLFLYKNATLSHKLVRIFVRVFVALIFIFYILIEFYFDWLPRIR